MTNINKSSKKRATSFELKEDPTKMHDILMNKSVLKMEIQFSMYDLFNNEKKKGFLGVLDTQNYNRISPVIIYFSLIKFTF